MSRIIKLLEQIPLHNSKQSLNFLKDTFKIGSQKITQSSSNLAGYVQDKYFDHQINQIKKKGQTKKSILAISSIPVTYTIGHLFGNHNFDWKIGLALSASYLLLGSGHLNHQTQQEIRHYQSQKNKSSKEAKN